MSHRHAARMFWPCLIILLWAAGTAKAVVIGKLYWANRTKDTISRCNLDGTGAEVLVSGMVNPLGPALAVGQQKMYWTEQTTLVIRRANFDGSSPQTIVSGLTPNPNGIAVDETHNWLFWTNDSGRVWRTTLDGTNKTSLRAAPGRTLNIAYEPVGNRIYWAEAGVGGLGTAHIWRANPDGTNMQDLILSGLTNPFSLALDLSARKMYWGDRSLHTISQANLDGTSVRTIATGIADPTSIAVDSAGGSLYYSTGSEIVRANLDGTNPVTFLSDQVYVFGLAVIPMPEPASVILGLTGASILLVSRRRVS
jgi:hypothetical protein